MSEYLKLKWNSILRCFCVCKNDLIHHSAFYSLLLDKNIFATLILNFLFIFLFFVILQIDARCFYRILLVQTNKKQKNGFEFSSAAYVPNWRGVYS